MHGKTCYFHINKAVIIYPFRILPRTPPEVSGPSAVPFPLTQPLFRFSFPFGIDAGVVTFLVLCFLFWNEFHIYSW